MGVLCEEDEHPKKLWLPRSEKQLHMSTQEIQVDNFCRRLVDVLNKVTPQNMDTLLDKISELNFQTEFSINKLSQHIVEKAESEPLYNEIYAEMCCTLNQVVDRSISSADSIDHSIPLGLFKSLVIKETHLTFDEIFRVESYGGCENTMNDSQLRTHRRKLFSVVEFLGQLYNVEFLEYNSLVRIINRLLSEQTKNSLEFQMECLCKLLRVVGSTMESITRRDIMDHCFEQMQRMQAENEFCARVRFCMEELFELRENNWVGRKLLDVPVRVDEIRNSFVEQTPRRRRTQKN